MNTIKAAYWIALAVFALALNSEYRHGKFPALHKVAGRAESTLCRLATRGEQALATMRFVVSNQAVPPDMLLASSTAEMAEVQADLREQARDKAELVRDQARAQAEMIRAQAQLQRAQIEQLRFSTRSRFNLSRAGNRRLMVVGPGACTKGSVRIAINSRSGSSVDASDDDEDSF